MIIHNTQTDLPSRQRELPHTHISSLEELQYYRNPGGYWRRTRKRLLRCMLQQEHEEPRKLLPVRRKIIRVGQLMMSLEISVIITIGSSFDDYKIQCFKQTLAQLTSQSNSYYRDDEHLIQCNRLFFVTSVALINNLSIFSCSNSPIAPLFNRSLACL